MTRQVIPTPDPLPTGAPNAGGAVTIRYTARSGDFDWFVLVPSGQAVAPQFTCIKRNAHGTVTVEWTGGGTLQAATAITGPWQDVTGATSPYTLTPTAPATFGRIRQ